jgi:hypothetical protein
MDDGCYVFGQHESESAFLLDLRVRDRLDNLRRSGQSPNHAVLFWDDARSDREVFRRAQLVARKLSCGGHITFASSGAPTHETERHLRELALRARELLGDYAISISVWLPERTQTQEPPPPLAAAWHRVQRFRRQQADVAVASQTCEQQRSLVVRRTLVA